MNRISTYTSTSGDAEGRNGEHKRNLWTSMLESVASGKRLPEKNLLVLGGTPELQREFLDSLSGPEARRNLDRQRVPPMANNFALGYTYYEVLDADQDDTLARVSLYLLSHPSGEFASLVAPLLTPETTPNTAVVILLDWSHPHLWLRQLWTWILVFQEVLRHTSLEARREMEDVMDTWKERGRGGSSVNLDGTPSASATSGDANGSLPLGPGEWTEPLGLPLCVVCQNAQKIDFLEKSKGWKEPDFDAVLQNLRTVLLRHGASLIYTSQNTPSQLPILIHSTLGITSLLKRTPLRHNVIDRDKIVVPPNWDSWGKIRVLGGSFDAEKVSGYWSEDIKLPLGTTPPALAEPDAEDAFDLKQQQSRDPAAAAAVDSAIAMYEDWCRDPNSGGLAVVESAMASAMGVAVDSEDTQDFLERQLKILEAYKAKGPEKPVESTFNAAARKPADVVEEKTTVNDHIGPVQFNMGGIQVDADDMLQRLKDRNNAHIASASEPSSPNNNNNNSNSNSSNSNKEGESAVGNMAKDFDNEQLQNFFSGLMNRTAPATDGARS